MHTGTPREGRQAATYIRSTESERDGETQAKPEMETERRRERGWSSGWVIRDAVRSLEWPRVEK